MKASHITDSDINKPRKRTKYDQQPKNNKLETSSYLFAKIERERDYFHTCIYSHRLLRRKTTDTCGEPNRLCAVTVGQY